MFGNSNEVVHTTAKKSWWDGSVIAKCGQKFPADSYETCWLKGGVTCPGCKKANKQGR